MDEEKIEEIKEKVFRHPKATDLYIKRIPIDAAGTFKQYANDHFVGDYGLCLKSLIDEKLAKDEAFIEIGQELAAVCAVIDEHEKRICALESKSNVRTIKMLNGRQIVKPIKEEKN